MKKLLLILPFLFIINCFSGHNNEKLQVEKEHRIIVIDSCEYIVYSRWAGTKGYSLMAHKGNCKYCEERRKK